VVTFPESFNKGVIFYSIIGEKVFEKQINEVEDVLSLQSLTKGLYIYQMQSDNFFKKQEKL
jgi:hypothetical protein